MACARNHELWACEHGIGGRQCQDVKVGRKVALGAQQLSNIRTWKWSGNFFYFVTACSHCVIFVAL